MAAEYEEEILELPLKPEFVEKMKEIEKQKTVGPFNNANELKAYIESLPENGED